MCVPICEKKMNRLFNRRSFLKTVAAGGAAAAVNAMIQTPVMANEKLFSPMTVRVNKVVDLSHQLTEDFPTFGGARQIELQTVYELKRDGYNLKTWRLNEHTGTHMDSPYHFSDGVSADAIPVENLVGPLCVVNIIDKANASADAQLNLDDLKRWERRYGRIPFGAIVAMNSGWDANVRTPKFRNADDKGGMHFPGFHIDAINWLLESRQVKGIFVDTLSLDYGQSADFAVHYKWLPANRWGIECVANLSKVPARGATVVVGGPSVAGATGGPTRVIALV
jgi:kynurenine formamidase